MRKKGDTEATEQGLPLEEGVKGSAAQAPETSTPAGDPPADHSGESKQPPTPPEPPVTVWGVCLTNIKHDRSYYRAGERVELPVDVFQTLQASKAVRRLGE